MPMTQSPLRDRAKKDLLDMARRRGISGYDGMTKDELVKVLSAAKTQKPPAKGAKPAAKPTAKPVAAPVRPSAKSTSKPAINGHANGHAKPAAKPAAPAAKPVAAPARLAAPPVAAKPAVPPPAKPAPAPKPTAKPLVKPESTIPPDKDLSVKTSKTGGPVRDQILLTGPDPFWLHAQWQLSVQAVQRAEAALGQDWHGAKPIIRVFDVTSLDTTSTSEAPIRDIVVHGGCHHWYIDVPQPPRSYRADIGYLSRRGTFFVLARSNVITPPKAGNTESLDDNWGTALDEKTAERLAAAHAGGEPGGVPSPHESDPFHRPSKDAPFGSGAVLPGKLKKFAFDMDAQLIVFGQTDPTATVSLQNEPVKLRPDGTFTMRFSLPDSRQIIPAVATSSDGMEEQTIVLAIERNTKRLDPMIHDLYADT